MKKVYPIKTEYGTFKAKIWFDKRDKAYLVETVGFDKSATCGNSLKHAKAMAKEVFELLCEEALDEGKAVVDSNMRIVGKGIKPDSVLTLVPSSTVAVNVKVKAKKLPAGLRASLRDVKEGRVSGPFNTVEELMADLEGNKRREKSVV